jgi:antitoxin CptB
MSGLLNLEKAPESAQKNMATKVSEHVAERARLRWRARRGLLENDLLITKYLDAYESQLTDAEVASLMQLLALGDNDLLELLLGRRELEGAWNTPQLRAMIVRMRDV